MSAAFKLSGLEEFKAAMARKSKTLQRELPKIISEVVDEAHKTAVDKAPKGETGDLKGSIEKKVSGLDGEVATEIRYGRFVEFGTKSHGAAQPFIRPVQKVANGLLMKKVLEVVKKK